MFVAASFLAAILLLGASPLTRAQQPGCSSSFSNASVAALIAENYKGGAQSIAPTITLQQSPEGFTFRVVCLASSGYRNRYRFVSIVAYFTTSDASVSPAGVPIYGQFEFECISSSWSAISPILDNTLFDRVTLMNTSPAINASLRTDCAYCLNPISALRNSDGVNHCGSCSNGCTQPASCYITDTSTPALEFTSICCNSYLSDGTCTNQCPQLSFPDGSRTCVPCSLSCQNGGTLRNDACTCDCGNSSVYGGTNCTTCLCQNGGTCSGSVCVCPSGYTGRMCENPCPSSCSLGYLPGSCSCVPCPLSCQNGGTLQNDTCACDCGNNSVYGGTNCTTCLCQNGGTCSGSVCVCPSGYTGRMCENPCPSSCPLGYLPGSCSCVPCPLSCQNGGTLRNDTCTCDCGSNSVYGGTSCTTCLCQNGGTCSGSVCVCPSGYTGRMCENPCPSSCPLGYLPGSCSCVSICPCNGASIQCGTYAATNAGSTNVTVTMGTYLKCSMASNVTSFKQHAVVDVTSSNYFEPGSFVLLKQLQAISASAADYQCYLQQSLQHNVSAAISSWGFKGLGLSYLTSRGTVESLDLNTATLSAFTASNDYTVGGSLDTSVTCPFRQLVQWFSSPSESLMATCRNANPFTTVATFSVSCV